MPAFERRRKLVFLRVSLNAAFFSSRSRLEAQLRVTARENERHVAAVRTHARFTEAKVIPFVVAK